MPTQLRARRPVQQSLNSLYRENDNYRGTDNYRGVVFGTPYSVNRLGGAYLTDVLGRHITTINGDRIIVIVKGGTLPITVYTVRTPI